MEVFMLSYVKKLSLLAVLSSAFLCAMQPQEQPKVTNYTNYLHEYLPPELYQLLGKYTDSHDFLVLLLKYQEKMRKVQQYNTEGVEFKYKAHGKTSRADYHEKSNRLVTASDDDTARILDAATGQCLQVLNGHTGYVWSAQFNQAGDKVVTASDDHTARIWDIATGACLKVLSGHTSIVWSAEFNQAGDKVVTVSDDGTACIWDVATAVCLRVLKGRAGSVYSAQFNQAGDKVVTVSSRGTACIWDVATGACLKVLGMRTGWIHSARFNHAGDKVVTASSDDTDDARIWDAATGVCLHVLEGHTCTVKSAQFNQAGDTIITASLDGTARIWRLYEKAVLVRYMSMRPLQKAIVKEVVRLILVSNENPMITIEQGAEYHAMPQEIKTMIEALCSFPVGTQRPLHY